MKKPDYLRIGKALLEASEGTHLTKLEKIGSGKPLKRDPEDLKKKAAASFLNKHGSDLKEKMKAAGGLNKTETKQD